MKASIHATPMKSRALRLILLGDVQSGAAEKGEDDDQYQRPKLLVSAKGRLYPFRRPLFLSRGPLR
jgi:hypothetical protein